MKEQSGQFAIAGAVVIAATIFAFAIHRLADSIENSQGRFTASPIAIQRESGLNDIGRFQLALTRGPEGITAIRIDTTTGNTAKFDDHDMLLVTEDYMKKFNLTKEFVEKQKALGFEVCLSTHWREMEETPSGIYFSKTPTPK